MNFTSTRIYHVDKQTFNFRKMFHPSNFSHSILTRNFCCFQVFAKQKFLCESKKLYLTEEICELNVVNNNTNLKDFYSELL